MKKEIIIITGGANGLGLELVKQSIEKGWFVCNIDRDCEKMDNLNNTYKDNYRGFIGDISDEEFVKKGIKEISALGDIKLLINNAGEPSFKMPTLYNKQDINNCFKGLEGMDTIFYRSIKSKKRE